MKLKIDKVKRFHEIYDCASAFKGEFTQRNLMKAAPGIFRVDDSDDGAKRLLFCTSLGASLVHMKNGAVVKTTTESKLSDLIYSLIPINMSEADFILGCQDGLGVFVDKVQSLTQQELGGK